VRHLWSKAGFRDFLHSEEGQNLLEYALVVILVAIVVIVVLTLLREQILQALQVLLG
jgi:Flp pilus assembly pilin Flp